MLHTQILHNTTNNTYHPMPFRASPRPSETLVVGETCRHKSIGHHTKGFQTLDEAVAHIKENEMLVMHEGLLEWDGDGIPA